MRRPALGRSPDAPADPPPLARRRAELFLGTYRDAEAEQPLADLIADLRREHVYEDVPLSGLDADEASGLLAALPASEAKRLFELSRGHPLFLGELLADDGGAGLPAGITEVVLRRVARLDPPELLSLAAVAGQSFAPAAIGVEEVVDPALAAGLLTESGRPGRVNFSHALIRQTLFAELSETRRTPGPTSPACVPTSAGRRAATRRSRRRAPRTIRSRSSTCCATANLQLGDGREVSAASVCAPTVVRSDGSKVYLFADANIKTLGSQWEVLFNLQLELMGLL